MNEKKQLEDLAVFGGKSLFEQPLHVGCPNIGDRGRFLSRLNDVLDRRWLTNDGVYVREFEKRVADLVQAKHCIATCNGTIALEIAIRASGMSGEVIVPSFTFIATAHALQWQGITPVFCDIDPKTYTIDPARVEEAISPKTTGIIGVHLWSRPCRIEELAEVARNRRLKLIFDSTHAFACTYKGKMIGNFGDAEVFSFHATKFINSLEGGAVVTNNDELAGKIRLMRNFGFGGYDDVIYIGTNGKMTEVSAAMGLTSLESIPEFVAVNKRNYKKYEADLRGIPGVSLVSFDENERNNYQYVVIDVDEAKAGISRDLLVELLWSENIRARRYFSPGCHQMEPYRSQYPGAGKRLPETERMAHRTMTLPTGTAVSADQAASICRLIRFLLFHGKEIRDGMIRGSKTGMRAL